MSDGLLSKLRSQVAKATQLRFGRQPIKIFQDVAAIPPGVEWERAINEAIGNSTFFVPIITPAFVESEWCCRELEKFLARESDIRDAYPRLSERRRIFPILYINPRNARPHDRGITDKLNALQFSDFQMLDREGEDSRAFRTVLNDLAEQIADLLAADRPIWEEAEAAAKEAELEAAEAAERARLAIERARIAMEAERQAAEQRRAQAEAEQARLDEEQRLADEARRKAEEEARRAKEAERQREEAAQNAARIAARRAEELAAQDRRKAEDAKRAAEEAARLKAEAQRKRDEEEARRKAEEARRLAEEDERRQGEAQRQALAKAREAEAAAAREKRDLSIRSFVGLAAAIALILLVARCNTSAPTESIPISPEGTAGSSDSASTAPVVTASTSSAPAFKISGTWALARHFPKQCGTKYAQRLSVDGDQITVNGNNMALPAPDAAGWRHFDESWWRLEGDILVQATDASGANRSEFRKC